MAGLPKSYIKKWGVSKKAWAEYRKDQKANKRKITKNKSIRVRNVAKKKKRRRNSKSAKAVPILPLIGGVVAPMARAFSSVGGLNRLETDPEGFFKGMIDQVGLKYTGIHLFPKEAGLPEGKLHFDWKEPAMTYGGLFLGAIGSKAATKFGVNRQIAKVPLLGEYIKL